MNCVMTRGLYLRADGRLPCYCSAGETITLGHIDHDNLPANIAADVFEAAPFSHIRAAMAEDKVPFPTVCEQCTYLDVDAEPAPLTAEARVLEWFHFEPAYACNLDCAWCHGQRRHDRQQEYMLPISTIQRVAEDFSARGYRLDKGNICGVGEPVLNRNVWKMVALLKHLLGGDILLSTNGNGPWSTEIVYCGLDKLKIAADATTQEGYARYRCGGRLERVVNFTARVAADKLRVGSKTPQLIWQYIMFDYNDSDEELLAYQKMAREHGVDCLRIVYTRCDNYSRRTPADFPVDFPDIQFFPIKDDSLLDVEAAHARLNQIERLAAASRGRSEAARKAMGLANHIFHRLLLGVERYVDLLAFTRTVRPIRHGNCADLDDQAFNAFRSLLGKLFRLLAEIRREQGDAVQARRYLEFLQQTGM